MTVLSITVCAFVNMVFLSAFTGFMLEFWHTREMQWEINRLEKLLDKLEKEE